MKFFSRVLSENLRAGGIFIGMVIGAGFFSLPYSIVKSGILWGVINFLAVFFIVLELHILYGYIVINCGRHRFSGYIKEILGAKAEKAALLNIIFTYYGTFLIYMVLSGFFLFNLFPFFSELKWAVLILFLASLFIFLNLKKIGDINFYLTLFLLISILFLVGLNIHKIRMENILSLNADFLNSNWLFPYGIFIFSLSGFSVIPEIADFFSKTKKEESFRRFKKTIKISSIIIALFYFIFIAAVLGILGNSIGENIFLSIKNKIGTAGFYTLSLIGFLAVATSIISLISDFKNIFYIDYKFPAVLIWAVFVVPVFILLLFFNKNLAAVISFLGSLGLGIFGLFILLMFEKVKKSEDFKKINRNFFHSVWFLRFLTSLLILGAVYETAKSVLTFY